MVGSRSLKKGFTGFRRCDRLVNLLEDVVECVPAHIIRLANLPISAVLSNHDKRTNGPGLGLSLKEGGVQRPKTFAGSLKFNELILIIEILKISFFQLKPFEGLIQGGFDGKINMLLFVWIKTNPLSNSPKCDMLKQLKLTMDIGNPIQEVHLRDN